MNTEYRMNAKNDFEKDFIKLMNNAVFGKTMENLRKHRDTKSVTIDTKRNKLVSEPNYHTTKWFSENLLAIEMKNIVIKANKPIYLGLAILSLSKIIMYEYWYDDMKPKYGSKVELCCILKQKIFIKILLMMLEKSMIHQIVLLKDHYQWVKIKN